MQKQREKKSIEIIHYKNDGNKKIISWFQSADIIEPIEKAYAD